MAPTKYDYLLNTGFHARPSLVWPPPPTPELPDYGFKRNPLMPPDFVVEMEGKPYTITEQINMYAQNLELVYPMVSPVHAATLGGFCPCQVLVGGGELLRDEQMYLAHKMANPSEYRLSDLMTEYNGENPDDDTKFPPTDVELLVFDDGPHAAPTLGHIDVAKHQYRSVSQFAAWALAKAQNAAIEIEDFVDECDESPNGDASATPTKMKEQPEVSIQEASSNGESDPSPPYINSTPLRAGYPLPPVVNHMNRFRVTRQGKLYPMEPPSEIPALELPRDEIGMPKGNTLAGWLRYRQALDKKYASDVKKGKCFVLVFLSVSKVPSTPLVLC